MKNLWRAQQVRFRFLLHVVICRLLLASAEYSRHVDMPQAALSVYHPVADNVILLAFCINTSKTGFSFSDTCGDTFI
jgi:hypothetical protein